MQTFPDISKKIRFLVLYLDARFSANKISFLLSTPLRTVQDWIKKTQEGRDIRTIGEGRGQKQQISMDIENKIVRQVREKPFKTSGRKLASKYDISRTSIDSILGKRGFKYGKVSSQVVLDDDQKLERITFCKKMLAYKSKLIKQTFFSDESGIWLSDAFKKHAWSKPNKKVKVEKPEKDVKLNMWGAVSFNGATSLDIFEGTLKAQVYKDILTSHKEEMEEHYEGKYFFQHDNHKAHKASETWMDNQGFNRIKFPSYSPDLSPIEGLWFTLKDRVASEHPLTERQLRRSLIRNWQILTIAENLEIYFQDLESRYRQCIQIGGDILPS